MKKIEKVELIREDCIEKSGVGRAFVGGLLFGPIGAVVAAQTKKDDKIVVFKVTYDKGNPQIVKTKKDTHVYRKYMKFVDKGLLK